MPVLTAVQKLWPKSQSKCERVVLPMRDAGLLGRHENVLIDKMKNPIHSADPSGTLNLLDLEPYTRGVSFRLIKI